MKAVFLGTPAFAVPTLEQLVRNNHDIAAVYTQPDRPKGRGRELAAPPVKEAAIRMGLAVRQPERIRRPEVVEELKSIAPEVMVVVGYGQIIPQAIIDIPPRGIINVHASLLPKYRGAAPIQWAIANGEGHTGVTTMRIDAGLDTGDMLLAWETAIGKEETAPELSERLARAGAELLVETLRTDPQRRPQNQAEATLAPILRKEDGLIDWNWPAAKIHARARGFDPWPGACTSFRGQALQVWKCRVAQELPAAEPGTLIPAKRSLQVACGEGTALDLVEVQLQGRKRIPIDAFLNGHKLLEKERLG